MTDGMRSAVTGASEGDSSMTLGGKVVNDKNPAAGRNPAPRPTVVPLFPAAAPSRDPALASAVRVFAAPVAVLACIALLRVTRHISIPTLTRDPMAIMDRSPMTGVLSNLGALMWMGAVTLCLFGAGQLRRRGRGEAAAFFLGFGALTALLLADDMFLIHDYYGPDYLGLGERPLFALYALIALALFVRFRNTLRSGPWRILAIALACFGASLLVDIGYIADTNWHHLVEDGTKWLGICGWFGFFWLKLQAELSASP